MSARGLPGFLRRSLRIDYDQEDDDDQEDDGSYEIEEDDEMASDQGLKDDDSQGSDAAQGRPPESGGTDATVSDDAKETQIRGIRGRKSDPKKSEATESTSDSQPDLSGSYQAENTSNRQALSDSWQEMPASSLPPPPSEVAPKLSYREAQFEKVLVQADVVSLVELRKLGWNGIPSKYRALSWKIMLGYVPTNSARRQQALQRKRSDYRDAMAQHYDIDDDTRTVQEQETLRQVLVDVPRTAPEVPLFRNDRVKRVLTRLLYIWAMRHPASSYVQGINDLATPLFIVFLADYYSGQDVLDGDVMNHLSDERLYELEADVYWCLTNLLSGIQDHYTSDQPGVQRMVMRLEELVNRIDANLSAHVREAGVQFLQFSFKWMNCLLLREFHLRCIPRLWDTYISESNGFEDFHVYVCAAFLCQFSSQLQEMSFDELFGFFQEMPTSDWGDTEIEMLLSQAYVLSTLFGGSDAHLTSNSSSFHGGQLP